jgi:hypothetical protein
MKHEPAFSPLRGGHGGQRRTAEQNSKVTSGELAAHINNAADQYLASNPAWVDEFDSCEGPYVVLRTMSLLQREDLK